MRILLSTAAVVGLALAVASPAQAQSPTDLTKKLLEAFESVKPLPEDGSDLSAADKANNKKAFDELDSYFDYPTMTAACIGPNKKKFSDTQTKSYNENFTELIRRVAYPDSGEFLKTSKYEFKKAKVKGNKADVPVYLTVEEEDLEMDIVFHWKKAGSWKLVDVSFDGAAITKDYQNQFGRIIGKDGVDGLLKKLTKRLERERKNSVL